MLEESIKVSRYHQCDPVIQLQYYSNRKLNIYGMKVHTLEKPKNEVEMIKADYRNEMHFFLRKNGSHYVILRDDIQSKSGKYTNSPIDVLAVRHRWDKATTVVLKESKRYIKDLSEFLKIDEFCSNECTNNKVEFHKISWLLKQIKVKI